ncbi:MAG: spermine synthase [Bacteroidetes bacterium B1(2017)]|nr:MAG: spermine synthase [Bacteroidetes bacterium B1(2017)]
MIKKWLSYLFPMPVKKIPSELHGILEINYENGKKILDTANSNYSFGSLQTILKTGLQAIHFPGNITTSLILGMGVGSVAHTIRYDFNSNCHIEFVEFDPMLIDLANTEFGLQELKNITLICADAYSFMEENKKQYDLVIVDLFIVDRIPEKFTEPRFINWVANSILPGGKLIFNTMRATLNPEIQKNIVDHFLSKNIDINILSKVGYTNDLILGKK